jgi:mannose-1-phosphate guanylyltransferase
VILSGGSGTRLWPLSRADRPKQFLSLVEDRSMIATTLARVAQRALFKDPMIVGSAQHAPEFRREMEDAGLREGLLVMEPSPRNTAPAIALAALPVED